MYLVGKFEDGFIKIFREKYFCWSEKQGEVENKFYIKGRLWMLRLFHVIRLSLEKFKIGDFSFFLKAN